MKNTHINHPEDSVLTGDLSVLKWFTSKGNLSVKVDGSPAIVWGTNPKTGNFFVGTKSVFNKVKIMINESHQDIERIIVIFQRLLTFYINVLMNYQEHNTFIKVIL